MPLPGAISAEKDMSLMFERWMQAFGLHGATPADKAMMAAWQQPSQLQDADKRKQNTALVQRKRTHSLCTAQAFIHIDLRVDIPVHTIVH